MSPRVTNLARDVNVFFVMVCFFVYQVATVAAQESKPKTFTVNYKLDTVHPGEPDLKVKFRLRNPYDFPVELLWSKASCACLSPNIEGSRFLQANEYRSMEMTIRVPKREMLLKYLVVVYARPDDDSIPRPTKSADALEIFRIQGDARQLAEDVSIQLSDGSSLPPSVWKAHALSDNWIRVDLSIDASSFEDFGSLNVSIPKVFLNESLSLKKRGNK